MALAPWLARAIASAPPWEARVPAPLSLASGRGGGVQVSARPRWHWQLPAAPLAGPLRVAWCQCGLARATVSGLSPTRIKFNLT